MQLSTISGLKPRLRSRRHRPARGRGAEGRRAHGPRHPARGRRSRTSAGARPHRVDRRPARAVVALRHRARRSKARTGGARRTTRTARTSRAASTTCSSRATRTRRSARTASGASTHPTSNVTSIFDRDSALDTTIASTLARGEPTPEGWEQELRVRFRTRPEVKEALERMWPVLSGPELVNDLFGFRALVRSASRDGPHRRRAGTAAPSPRSRRRRRRRGPKPTSRSSTRPTRCSARSKRPGPRPAAAAAAATRYDTAERVIDDLGLRGYADAATLAEPVRRAASNGNGSGHEVVVRAPHVRARTRRRGPGPHRDAVADAGAALPVGLDDARRRPRARRASPARSRRGTTCSSHLPTHNATRFVSLSINYRTPSEVMDVASQLLAVAAPTVEPSRSVRSTGEYPRFVAAAADDLVADHERRDARRAGAHGRGRGDRAARAARRRSSRRSPMSARSRRQPTRSTRRSRSSTRRAPRASSSTTSSSSNRRSW